MRPIYKRDRFVASCADSREFKQAAVAWVGAVRAVVVRPGGCRVAAPASQCCAHWRLN